jgi:poly-gamma-glutamate synthesis protein (capsule biosynthesis protein)
MKKIIAIFALLTSYILASSLLVEARHPDAPYRPSPVRQAKIQLAGDILLHANVVAAARAGEGYDFNQYFETIAPYFDGDLTIVNMETPIDAYGDNATRSTFPRFNVPREILPALKKAGIDMLVTANNHAFDQGFSGLARTRELILEAGFLTTGTTATPEQYDEYTIINVNGIKVGVIAYSSMDNGLGALIPAEMRPYAMRRFSENASSAPAMIADMERCREAGAELIILSLHWGAEYVDAPTRGQKELARLLVEGGADIVMGNHSHCVQPIELVETSRGKRLIFYSLGNFFVDQNNRAVDRPKTQYGMLANINVKKIGSAIFLEAAYLPTFTYKYRDTAMPNNQNFRLVPMFGYQADGLMADVYLYHDNEGRRRHDEAYAHVLEIAGDAIPVYTIKHNSEAPAILPRRFLSKRLPQQYRL